MPDSTLGSAAGPSAEDIVRRLADDGMIVHTGAMSHECASCGAFVPTRAEDHRPDCLWVAAVEWVKRNG